jgi:hypothetical protein
MAAVHGITHISNLGHFCGDPNDAGAVVVEGRAATMAQNDGKGPCGVEWGEGLDGVGEPADRELLA